MSGAVNFVIALVTVGIGQVNHSIIIIQQAIRFTKFPASLCCTVNLACTNITTAIATCFVASSTYLHMQNKRKRKQ